MLYRTAMRTSPEESMSRRGAEKRDRRVNLPRRVEQAGRSPPAEAAQAVLDESSSNPPPCPRPPQQSQIVRRANDDDQGRRHGFGGPRTRRTSILRRRAYRPSSRVPLRLGRVGAPAGV